MSARPKVGIVVGTTRPASVGRPVADAIVPLLEAAGAEPVVLDLREIDLPLLDEALPPASGVRTQPHTIAWGERIDAVDAVVFLTPEYNHGYTAAMKNAIDSLLPEWKGKQGLVVGYGWSGASLAIAQLTDVLTFVGVELGEPVLMPFQPTDLDERTLLADVSGFVDRFADELRSALAELVARVDEVAAA